jgi:putrescine importer
MLAPAANSTTTVNRVLRLTLTVNLTVKPPNRSAHSVTEFPTILKARHGDSSLYYDLESPRIHIVPFWAWATIIIVIITYLNLRGIKATTLANKVLLAFMSLVIVLFIILAVIYLSHHDGWSGLFSIQPFYNPPTFDSHKIWTATSFAALTYIGFDGVTTLAEEVQNPKRNVLLATVLVCLFTGVLGGLEVYLGARVWPDWKSFPNLETAFMDVCRRVGGPLLFHAMAGILILAAFGSALTGSLSAARLLFGMGRDDVLPRSVFAHLSSKGNTPTYNLCLIGAIALIGAVAFNYVGHAYEHAGELINFGAFLSFMGVNFAAFWQFAVKRTSGEKLKIMWDAVLPLFGFMFCGLIWWNLNHIAKTVGGIWFFLGVLFVAIKTRGFREQPVTVDFGEPSYE